jgi:hypothetical protein
LRRITHHLDQARFALGKGPGDRPAFLIIEFKPQAIVPGPGEAVLGITLEAPKHGSGDLTLEAFERLRDGSDVGQSATFVRLRRASRMADPTREATT